MMLAPMTPGRLTTSLPKSLSNGLGVALAVTFALGCSADRHTFRSTPTAPKSVSVTYVQSGDTAWSYDIPIGHQLTLEFNRQGQFDGFRSPNTPATSMKWYTSPLTSGQDATGNPRKGKAEESGEVELSGQPVQFSMSLRDPAVEEAASDPLDAVPAPPPPSDDAMEAPRNEPTEQEPMNEAMDDAAEAGAMEEAAMEEQVDEAAEPAMDK